jgi:predicted MFS family arabinose efflux permease
VSAPEAAPPLRRNRDFRLLWSGQVVSTLGSEMSALAFPLLVLALTGSPAKAGLVGFARSIPFLLVYLPAGALVDRLDRKRVMIAADTLRALALGSVAIALAAHRATFAQLVVVSTIEGTLFVFFQLSEGSALPHVVGKEQLPRAMSLNEARTQGAGLVGGPLGGVLFGLGRLVPFAVDAASYAVSAWSLVFVRASFQERRPRTASRLRSDIAEGVGWLWRQTFLRSIVFLNSSLNFVFRAFELVVIVRAKELGASPGEIGAIFACFGAAAVLGSLAAPWVQRRLRPSAVVLGALWLTVPTMIGLAFVHEPLLLGAVVAPGVFLGPIYNVVVGSYRYALVPDRLLARVQSASLVLSWGSLPLGALFGGLVAQALGGRDALLVLGGTFLACALGASSVRSLRHAPRPEELTPLSAAASPAAGG